ncbi:MAG: Rrf2 family transcriptional regulator [Opitutaceae bacterium]|nr:Rrf2 family transcriptional regulator [Opitutaceae bacterium]
MLRYGKTAQNAIAAMSYLAEGHREPHTCIGSQEIATARKLPKSLVAKILTQLSKGGLVNGSPGPKGGYWLSRSPEKISLFEIITLFEKAEEMVFCPFGRDYCGNHDPCPLHDEFSKMEEQASGFLKTTHLGVFRKS